MLVIKTSLMRYIPHYEEIAQKSQHEQNSEINHFNENNNKFMTLS